MADSVKRRIPSATVAGFRRASGRCPEHETSDGMGLGDITGSHNMVYVNPTNFVKRPLCKLFQAGIVVIRKPPRVSLTLDSVGSRNGPYGKQLLPAPGIP